MKANYKVEKLTAADVLRLDGYATEHFEPPIQEINEIQDDSLHMPKHFDLDFVIEPNLCQGKYKFYVNRFGKKADMIEWQEKMLERYRNARTAKEIEVA